MKFRALIAGWLTLVLVGCASFRQGEHEEIRRGWLDRAIFDVSSFADWKLRYDTTQVAPDMIELLRQVHSGVTTVVFFGTWCSDSKRELPHFLKIADLAGMAPKDLKFYGLDRSKKSDDGLTDRYKITRVPTFIFMKDDQEIGRITEIPQTTLEGDMLTILAGAQSK